MSCSRSFGGQLTPTESRPQTSVGQLFFLTKMLPPGQTAVDKLAAYGQLFELFDAAGAGAKPIAIMECGYPADTFNVFYSIFAADPFKQDRFYRNLFYELSTRPNPVEFVISWQVRDSDKMWERRRDAGFDPIFLEFYKYFRDIGLYDADGNERPAARRWREELALPRIPKT